jgi:hypothetical protein
MYPSITISPINQVKTVGLLVNGEKYPRASPASQDLAAYPSIASALPNGKSETSLRFQKRAIVPCSYNKLSRNSTERSLRSRIDARKRAIASAPSLPA